MGYNLCFKQDVIANFHSLEAAIRYANLEFDSHYGVDAVTGEGVASQCLHEND